MSYQQSTISHEQIGWRFPPTLYRSSVYSRL